MPERTVTTPIGPVLVVEEGAQITGTRFAAGRNDQTKVLQSAERQLTEYFEGRRTEFDLPLKLPESPETRRFLAALAGVPFGETRTYGELAAQLGLSAKAVGKLCGSNPFPVIIPCHRVLGAGSLGGFSAPGGVEAKIALLRHEGAAGLLI